MRVHHATKSRLRTRIEREGFRESARTHATGVFLSPPGWLWVAGGMEPFDPDCVPDGDDVVYAFDLPDDEAERYAVWEEHPATGEMFVYEYCVPAEVANRYLVGIVEPPETGEEFLSDVVSPAQ
jgi:hypothetical protein